MKKQTSSKLKKLAVHFIVFSLLTVFLGKAFFVSSDYIYLYAYGVSVTLVLLVTFFVAIWKYEDPAELAQAKIGAGIEAFEEPLVTCLVSVYNEEEFVGRCLDSLLNQTYQNRELIIVNDGSSDGTKERLEAYQEHDGVTILNLESNLGKKRALAEALLIARGEILAFTDSDSIWHPDVLQTIVPIFQADPAVGGVSGHGRALNADDNLLTKVQDSWYEGQFAIRKAFESVFGAVTCLSGPLAVMRREAIFNYIPAWSGDTFLGDEFKFSTDRTLTGFLLGQTTIGNDLKKRYADSEFVIRQNYPAYDWKVVYTKAAKSWTIVPNTFARMIHQQIRWKKSFIRNIFFTGSFYWKKPFLPSLFYYLHVLFVLVGPLIAFRHLVYLPLRGDPWSIAIYLAGIVYIGLLFGIAYKLENPKCTIWIYRPIMSLLSTLCLSWLIFYSAATIKKMTWTRG